MYSLTLLVTLTCYIGLVSCVSWMQPGQGEATIYTLRIEADVTIQNEQNLDQSEFFHTGQYAESTKKRALLRFEDVPSECTTVNWAKMYVYKSRSYRPDTFTNAQSPDIARSIEVYMVHKHWDEQLATRARRSGDDNWVTPMVDLTGRDAGPQAIDEQTVYPSSPPSFVEFDVSSALAQKRDHNNNHGYLLRAQNEDVVGTDIWWYGRRHQDTSKHAFINVMCNNPSEPAFDSVSQQTPQTRSATNRAPAQRPSTGYDTYSQGSVFGIPLGQVLPDVSNARVCDDVISLCPSTYPIHGRLLRHPTNPARYCSCRFCDAQGVTMRDMACPAGTVFNYHLQECTYAEDCGCN